MEIAVQKSIMVIRTDNLFDHIDLFTPKCKIKYRLGLAPSVEGIKSKINPKGQLLNLVQFDLIIHAIMVSNSTVEFGMVEAYQRVTFPGQFDDKENFSIIYTVILSAIDEFNMLFSPYRKKYPMKTYEHLTYEQCKEQVEKLFKRK